MAALEVRMPKYPECWETCGNCARGDITVWNPCWSRPATSSNAMQRSSFWKPARSPSTSPPRMPARVVEVFVEQYDPVAEGALVMSIAAD